MVSGPTLSSLAISLFDRPFATASSISRSRSERYVTRDFGLLMPRAPDSGMAADSQCRMELSINVDETPNTLAASAALSCGK